MTPINLGVIGQLGPEPRTCRARRTDPGTSHKAAERAEDFAPSHERRILAAIRYGTAKDHLFADSLQGAAVDAIEEFSGLTIVQIDRRLKTMQRAGLIEVVQHEGKDLVRNGYRCWRETSTAREGCDVLEAVA